MAQGDQDVEDLLKEWGDAPVEPAPARDAKDGWDDGVTSAEMGLLTDAAVPATPAEPAADPADLLGSLGDAPAADAPAGAADDLLAQLAAPAQETALELLSEAAAPAMAQEAAQAAADDGWGDEAPKKDDDWGAEASAEDGWGEASAPAASAAPATPAAADSAPQSVDDLLAEMSGDASKPAPAEDWGSMVPATPAKAAVPAGATAPAAPAAETSPQPVGEISLEDQALAALTEDEDVKRLDAMGDGVTFRPPPPSLGARFSAVMFACLMILLRPCTWALGRMEPRLRPVMVEKTGVTWHEWANGVIGAFVLLILVGLIFLGI